MDQAFEAQAAQVVGHLRGGVGPAEQGRDLGAEVAVAEAAREMREAAEGLEQRHDARVAEAQGRDALAVLDGGLLEAIEGVLGQHAVVADALDFEQLAVDVVPQVAQVRRGCRPPCSTWKSIGLLMVVSVRRARCSLKYCLTCDALYSTCRLGSTPSVMTRVR